MLFPAHEADTGGEIWKAFQGDREHKNPSAIQSERGRLNFLLRSRKKKKKKKRKRVIVCVRVCVRVCACVCVCVFRGFLQGH